MALFTADWNPLGDTYYRKFELCQLTWMDEINVADYLIAAAPFGGPIALIRDDKKIQSRGVTLPSLSGKTTIIYIFSAFGNVISSIKWTNGEISLLTWSNREDLLCVQDDGMVFEYDIYGKHENTFTLDQEIKDTKVFECKSFQCVHGTGIAVLTTSMRFFVLNNIKNPKIRRLPEIPGLEPNSGPTSWCIITSGKDTQLLVAKEGQLYLLNSNDNTCLPINLNMKSPYTSIIEMSVSFDSTHIALFTDTGILWLGQTSNELRTKNCEYETHSKAKPRQLLWCGQGAIVGLWKNVLLGVGHDKEWFNYVTDGPVHLVCEIDGIRIIGNSFQEFLQQVPPVVDKIFRIGSTSAGTHLLAASKEFQRHSHRADEYIRLIREKNEIEIAVQECIEAAGHECSVSTQKMLLRAASFGKCFVPQMDSKPFVEMCQTLRVLNAIRQFSIGLPLTYDQLQFLSMSVLLDRLVLRRHFCLAIRMASYLKIPNELGASRILANWACYKVNQTFSSDEQIAFDISNKLGYAPGVSYAEVANKAIECGRAQLAIKLLDNELRASEQVPLLLKLKQHRQALQRAIESGDTDLIHTVIIRLRDILPSGEFLITIRNYPIAYSLFRKYCKEEDKEKLRDMFYQEDDFNSEANCWLSQSLTTENMTQKQSYLHGALDSFRKARNEFSVSQVEDQLKLLKYQIKLEEKYNKQYLNLSVSQTLIRLLVEKEYKLAEELKKDFKIPDKRFWWTKMKVLAEEGQWLELEKFSKVKKSPIGYEPFVDISLKFKNRFEAQKYVSKVREENRVKYCVKAGMLEEAAKIAFEAKDEYALDYVFGKCGSANRMLAEKINNMKLQIGKK